MKIHYTIYNGNYDRGEDSSPICNDNKRMSFHDLTRDVNEITCKRCMRSKIASNKFALEVFENQIFPLEPDTLEKLKQEIEILENKIS